MSTINFVTRIIDAHFDPVKDGGENAVFTITTPVIGPVNRELFSGLASANELWNTSMRRRAEHEDEVSVGAVSGFSDDRFTFLMPAFRSGATGLPKGAYVVTNGGIVGAIVGAKAQAGEIARRLIEVGGLTTERVLGEQPAVEYDCVMIGGMVTTPQGMAYYYRPPIFLPTLLESVHTTPQPQFFVINETNLQSTHLLARLAFIIGDKRIDPYLAAAMLNNAARYARHDPEAYREAVLDIIGETDFDRANAISAAALALPDVTKESTRG